MTSQSIFLKILIVGKSNSGKSCLLSRICRDQFDSEKKPTLGAEQKMILCTNENVRFHIQFWDVEGKENATSMFKLYVKGAHLCIVVSEHFDPESIKKAKLWKDLIDNAFKYRENSWNLRYLLVFTKSDLKTVKKPTNEDILYYKSELGYIFFIYSFN